MGATETITWHSAAKKPDPDVTVLLSLDLEDCLTWPGYWDGEVWRNADGIPYELGIVLAWANQPHGIRYAPKLAPKPAPANDFDPLGR